MSTSIQQILEKYSNIASYHSGPRNTLIRRISDPQTAEAGDLIFVEQSKYLSTAIQSSASVLLINENFLTDLPESPKTILCSPNVMLLVSRLLRDFFATTSNSREDQPSLHPSAVIAPSAKISKSAVIGPFVVIDANVEIGEKTVIGSHCHIQKNTKIGRDCIIHPHVFIAYNCEIHDRVEIHPQSSIGTEGFGYAHDQNGRHERIPHSGRVIIEQDVHLGAGVFVDRGVFKDTRIGEGTKVDNACHFGHNATVGKHCLIAGGLLMAGSSTIGNHVVIGGSTTIAGHIHIVDGAQIGGFSTIGKSVEVKGPYQGYPLQPLQEHKRIMASLITLPKIRKDVVRILRKLDLFDLKD